MKGPDAASRGDTAPAAEAAPIRIVIAEDDVAVRAVLTEVIRGEPDLELVGAAADAETAIDLVTAEKPDVAILDVRMPGGGGVHAASRINELSPGVRLIALSGHYDPTTKATISALGVVGFLLKGDSIDLIVQMIRDAAAGRLDHAHGAEQPGTGTEPNPS